MLSYSEKKRKDEDEIAGILFSGKKHREKHEHQIVLTYRALIRAVFAFRAFSAAGRGRVRISAYRACARAVRAVRDCRRVPAAVSGRADLFGPCRICIAHGAFLFAASRCTAVRRSVSAARPPRTGIIAYTGAQLLIFAVSRPRDTAD